MAKNIVVTDLLDQLGHPFRAQLELIRKLILDGSPLLRENIKWNGPNYHIDGQDRITIRVQPAAAFQVIFHTGAKQVQMPKERLLKEDYGLLIWKGKDRAVLDLKDAAIFERAVPHIAGLVADWIRASF